MRKTIMVMVLVYEKDKENKKMKENENMEIINAHERVNVFHYSA